MYIELSTTQIQESPNETQAKKTYSQTPKKGKEKQRISTPGTNQPHPIPPPDPLSRQEYSKKTWAGSNTQSTEGKS
jgi:hypothetical protein